MDAAASRAGQPTDFGPRLGAQVATLRRPFRKGIGRVREARRQVRCRLKRPAAMSSIRRSCSSTDASTSLPVEDEERFHRGVPDALVAIQKGVVTNKGETQRSSLVYQREVEIDAVEGRSVEPVRNREQPGREYPPCRRSSR
jgi:hypothetical protein